MPLYHLTKKTVKFQDTPELRESFNVIRTSLVNPPVLAYANPDLPYELISDASEKGCGAILIQANRVVAYYSAKFIQAEGNYGTGEQELLGIIKALKEWRCYLEGCKELTIITDHNPLTYFLSQPLLSRRQARWSEFMLRFQFEIKHIKGVLNPADPLSRLFAIKGVWGTLSKRCKIPRAKLSRSTRNYTAIALSNLNWLTRMTHTFRTRARCEK